MAPDDAATRGRKRDYSDFEASGKRTEDSHKIQELEGRLDAITKVGEWRLEQLKLMDAEKRAAEKTVDEERKLFAELGQDQSRQQTAQIQALQEHWSSLMNNRNMNGIVGEFQAASLMASVSPLRSELPFFDHIAVHCSLESRLPVGCCHLLINPICPFCQTATGKLEKALHGMREQLSLRTDERDKWKTKCKNLERVLFDAQQQVKKLTAELERCKAESVKFANARSEGNNLEEVCRDLLEQVEQRNLELQRCKAESSKGQLAGLQQQIYERDEEIQALRRIMDDRLGKKIEASSGQRHNFLWLPLLLNNVFQSSF